MGTLEKLVATPPPAMAGLSATLVGETAPVAPLLLGRPPADDRLLPPITPRLYAPAYRSHPSEGRRLLGAAAAPLPFRQRVLARGLTPEGRLRRAVWLHAQAFAAELAGQHERADYYWDLSIPALLDLLADPAARATPLGRELPQRLLDELFIDTHCALYNGHVLDGERPLPGGRAFAHASRIVALAGLAPGGARRYGELLGSLYLARAMACEAAGQAAEARVAYALLADLYPDEALYERSVGGPRAAARRPEPPPSVSLLDAPVLTPVAPAALQRGEPFELWFFSRADVALKALAASAALLLALAIGLTALEALNSATRDAAYARMLDAAGRGDYVTVLDAAPAFLRARPLAGADARVARVRDLYAEAFVRWFSSLDAAEAAAARPRIEQFRALMGAAPRARP